MNGRCGVLVQNDTDLLKRAAGYGMFGFPRQSPNKNKII
jgi:hypothetical protein